ncbi:hypothetical protein [Massilia sp. CT11-137]|uniref:hypothetical protein n=1 Tax=Massilia sp. CT11-137 TaxID=3393901 RepID=UPI0039AFA3DB
MDTHTTKTCSKCKQNLPLNMFGVHKQKKDGLRAWCKPCNQADTRRWGKSNPEKKAAGRKDWAEKNPDRWKAMKLESQHRNRASRLPKQRVLAKQKSEALSDNYVLTALRIDRNLVSKELIDLKRVQIMIYRYIRGRK